MDLVAEMEHVVERVKVKVREAFVVHPLVLMEAELAVDLSLSCHQWSAEISKRFVQELRLVEEVEELSICDHSRPL